MTWKPRRWSCSANLGHQFLRRARADARDGVQQGHLRLKWGQAPAHLRVQFADQAVQVVQMGQMAGHQEALMGVKAPN